MQSNKNPTQKDLVLVGGGHSHAIVLRMLGMNPLPGLRLTLITDTSHTPYSGMLPGHVAGFYSFEETHIDLRRLAQFAQTQFYLDRAIGLNLNQKQVICSHHPPVKFDYLSLDIGSTPANFSILGATEYAIPAKPVPQFLCGWNNLLEQVTSEPQQNITIAIVGGGAGGVELALNMHSHLQRLLRQLHHSTENLQIHLFHRREKLLSGHNQWVSRHLETILRQRGVKLHLPESVTQVLPNKIICSSGLEVECNYKFWVTQASAPDWIKDSGLTTDSQGFVLVQDTLQSVSHPDVFAAGDIATMENFQRPKAGVFAVRQGQPLYKNLRHLFLNEPLEDYTPQKRYLGLIGTGDKNAIASWANWGWQSPWLWRWKDRIDRKFMNLFAQLPKMEGGRLGDSETRRLEDEEIMYCAGCGSKVGSSTLKRVLQRLPVADNQDVLVGIKMPDDAAVVKMPKGRLMVHTIDYFTTLVNDPFVFGQIATNHCLSDIFAMGATPHTALAVATIPHGTPAAVEETLFQLLSGAMQVLNSSQTSLIGGHTTEGEELAFGLASHGLVAPEQILRNNGMELGQVLILTKALGTGTLFAAHRQFQAKGYWIDEAIESMLQSNQSAAQVFLQYEVSALTDITGFGLLGHLQEMLPVSSAAGVKLNLAAIPALTGALTTLEQGLTSSLHSQNLKSAQHTKSISELDLSPKYHLLFDPQTSGGLLGAVPAQQVKACLQALRAQGYTQSSVIGEVIPKDDDNCPVIIV